MNELGKGIVMFGMQQAANTIGGNTAQKRQKELMGIQLENQKKLNNQGRDIQMDMWNKTNYGAQVKHMKDAGLSPGLMYGKGGAGGTTTGSQGGGSAASGGAPSRAQIGIEGLMAGHQMALMEAQTRDINASAENKEKGERDNLKLTGNVLKEQVKKLKSEIGKNNAAKKLAISQKEKNDLEKEILEIDVNFLKDNDISTEEWGIIKAGKQLLGGMEEFLEWNSKDSYMVWNPEQNKWELQSK